MTTAVRGLPDGPASAILLEQLRTRLRWWLPRLCVSLIQPDSRGHDPYLLVTAADRDGAVVVDPADGSYRWRGTGELVGTAEGMVHTIQQIAQQMGVFTAEPVRGHPHLPPQPSEPSLGMLPVQQRPSTPAEDLARLRADFGPYGWMFVHDPFHQVWHALRGRQERLNASCAAELRTALGRHPGTRRPGRTPPWGQH